MTRAHDEANSDTARLAAIVGGPLLHDMRGALGVIRLAAQLLVEQGGGGSTTTRIEQACRRLSNHFEELRAHLHTLTPDARFEPEPGHDWSAELGAWLEELRLDLPRRQLDWRTAGSPRCDAPGNVVRLIAAGLTEVALRTTSARQGLAFVLSTTSDGGLRLQVEAEGVLPSDELLRLLALPPRTWPFAGERELPARVILADRLAHALGGRLGLDLDGERYRGWVELPAPP